MAKNKPDTSDRELLIRRILNAPIDLVWEVWTQPEHIAQWWGPDGFRTTISKMDIQPEGEWDLIMHGADGTDYKNKSVFKEIVWHKKIVYNHVSGPKFIATISFEAKGDQTAIEWHMLFETRESFIQTIKTFRADEGLKQNIDKLNRYLEAKGKLMKQFNPLPTVRTCTYVNFPGNTEAAMLFYQSIFKTAFIGKGIQRFGDAPAGEGQPPLSDADKNLVLHAELPITGGHVLMATDAPASMGFTIERGNNMHICIEPESRQATKEFFDALAEGGVITMPLMDMFWGAYYGSCTDQYGINWMVNFSANKGWND